MWWKCDENVMQVKNVELTKALQFFFSTFENLALAT